MKLNRPYMPLQVKLDACLLMLKLDPADVQWDHDPALGLRIVTKRDEDGNPLEYDPPANDPRFITPRPKAGHKQKTTGRKVGAAKTVTTYGSDAHAIAKTRRLERTREENTLEGWTRIILREKPAERPKARIPSRPFPKRVKDKRRGKGTGRSLSGSASKHADRPLPGKR